MAGLKSRFPQEIVPLRFCIMPFGRTFLDGVLARALFFGKSKKKKENEKKTAFLMALWYY
jgi:hypothetical protein